MTEPLANTLLQSLPKPVQHALNARLRPVSLRVGEFLYESNKTPRYIHFLTSGLASVVTRMADGSKTEVCTIGREGAPQVIHLVGPAVVPTACFMQLGGTGLRMPLREFQEIFLNDIAIRGTVLRFLQYQALLLSQMAGCNRFHPANARLACLLLMMCDRTGEDRYRLSQAFLGEMIGSRRATVNAVVAELVATGAIANGRGHIQILDRDILEQTSCECYGVTRTLLHQLRERPSV